MIGAVGAATLVPPPPIEVKGWDDLVWARGVPRSSCDPPAGDDIPK
jgi:hypothetical protein